MEEQPEEVINIIQQYLPTRDKFNSRLVNHLWKHSLDHNDPEFWSQMLYNLTRQKLNQSYLIQSYTFPDTNQTLNDHPLQSKNMRNRRHLIQLIIGY